MGDLGFAIDDFTLFTYARIRLVRFLLQLMRK